MSPKRNAAGIFVSSILLVAPWEAQAINGYFDLSMEQFSLQIGWSRRI